MRRVILVIGSLLIVTALVAPVVLVWSALYTTSGLQFVVRHLPQQLGPVHLTIEGVSGTVAGGLHVDRVEVDHELVHITVTGIDGRLAVTPLVLQTIRVKHARVQSVSIEVRRRKTPSLPGPGSFLPSWLIVNAEDGEAGSVTLTVYNGFHLEARDLRGAAVVRHTHIRVFQAEGQLAEAHISAAGELRATDPLGMEMKGRIDWLPEGQPRWTLTGSARGDLNLLSIVAHTTSPCRADLTGELLDVTTHWHWVADAAVQDFDLHAWQLNTPLGSITGHVEGSGDESGFSAHGLVNPTGLHAGAFDAQFAGSYADHVLTARHMEARHVTSGAHAKAEGTIAVVEHGPRLDLKGEWTNFRWPLVGHSAVHSAAGSFALAGILPYRVRVSGRGSAADLPEMTLDASGALGKDGFTFDAAEVDLFQGHASVSGSVAWAPQQAWAVAGRATGIDLQAFREDLPGRVSFAINASGRGFDTRGDFSASFSQLSGKVRGLAVSGGGTVARAGRTWSFSNVRVGLGTATLGLDGSLSDRADLRFALVAHDLSLLAPGMRGQIRSSGAVKGTLAEPEIVATARGGDFEYEGLTLEALDATVNFNPGAAGQESSVDLRLRNLSFKGRAFDSMSLSLKGPPAAYDVRFAASAKGLSVNAQAHGAYANQSFDGELAALSISGNESLHLSLERPVALTAAPHRVRVDWLCLVGTPGSICADGKWTPAAWATTITINELPLETLTAGKTPAVDYKGTVTAHAQLSGGAATPVQGALTAQLTGAEVIHRLASHKLEHTRIGSGTVSVTATPAAINAKLDLGDGPEASIHGTLELERDTPRWQDMPLAGQLRAQTNEASLLTLYVPDIDRAVGHLGADMHLAGTAGEPRLTGMLNVSDGEIDVFQVNLSLRAVSAQAQLTETGIDFKGSASAGKGQVSTSGHMEWRELLPYGKLHLAGTNLRVADIPEAQIDASPDLDFDVKGRRIEVTGTVTIPYARIQPKDITNAVSVSPDQVIVGAEPEDVNRRFTVLSTITLVLGDRVNVDALGLTARLVGSVTIRNGFDAITHGSGELSVAEGRYTAFARALDIQRGRLIFAGGPITNPGIDVRAQKQFPDVTAGVNVRGTLQQPHISFFSEPPLAQTQIASLILAGGSLESAQNASSAALGQGAAILAAQLGGRVGIPDVSLETDPIANQTSLVLGRYLSPRLYVSYGVSLTEQLNTFKMRYTLNDHWTIRTEVGQAYGADLVFSITR
jgi:translocation and assembly module TamB